MPTPVAGGVAFSTIATDGYPNTDGLTCAIAADSAAYCWGGNRLGELGDSSYLGSQATPQRVVGGLKFTAITVGEAHACALAVSGAAYCWGSGELLGNGAFVQMCGPTPCSTYPVPVSVVPSFTQLAAGLNYTCGLTAAGEAHCWGYNDSGQLGNGRLGYDALPTVVLGGLHFST
ncbi:MAG: RCC1 domain-containing protein, partial [Gemmatimonadales bacterium]